MNAGEESRPDAVDEVIALREEVARLKKIVRVLMDRSERITGEAVSEYGLFQRQLVLGEVVHKRTEQLRQALYENQMMTRRLRESEAKFRSLAEQSLVGIAVTDGTRFVYANDHFANTFGYTQAEMMALPLMDTVAATDSEVVAEHLRACQADEAHDRVLSYQGHKKDGSLIDLELSSSRMIAGDDNLVLVVTDVTARKKAEHEVLTLNERLTELASRDPLTGLYNRRLMEDSMERETAIALRRNTPLSVVMCDIDRFKAVNDTYGHQAGDEVLKAFASLLESHCRRSDIAYRYGGEEFIAVFPGMAVGPATDWAERQRIAVSEAKIPTESGVLRITASYGVASFPAHGRTWQEVVMAADTALYTAKISGRNQVRRAPFPVSSADEGHSERASNHDVPRSTNLARGNGSWM
jgi:diguanylate cyclase (GGDEF)-like protein/PAS domain S-box-containing protein